jgi:hypothetical protein
MPKLLNNSVALTYTSGTNTQFLGLGGAQPYLGLTPTYGTGYTLVSGANGQPVFVSALGGVYFNSSTIVSQFTNTDLILSSTGTGKLRLTGDVVIDAKNLTVTTATFTDLTVKRAAVFESTTTAVEMLGDLNVSGYVDIAKDLTVTGQLEVFNNVTFEPNNGIVTIQPSGAGFVTIDSGSVGTIDNINIGQTTPANARFNILTATTFVISNTAFEDLTVSNLTVTNNLVVGSFTTPTLNVNTATVNIKLDAKQINQDGRRVVTDFIFQTSTGIAATTVLSDATATFVLTNTGVTSLIAGSDISLTSSTGAITVSNTSTLQSVVGRGATANQVVTLSNSTPADYGVGALVVSQGGISVANGIYVAGTSTFLGSGAPEYTVLFRGGNTGAQFGIGTSGTPSFGIANDVLNATKSAYSKYNLTASEIHFNIGNDTDGSVVQTNALSVNTDGTVSVTSETAAEDQTTGALKVAGGVGIGGTLYAGDIYSNGFIVSTASSLTFEYQGSVLGAATTVNLASGLTATLIDNVINIESVSVSGVSNILAGTDTSISTSTGVVTIWNTSTLQSVTDRGSTTTNAVNIASTTSATSTSTGALIVDGGVGVKGSVYSREGHPDYNNLLYTPRITLSIMPPVGPRLGDFWYDENATSYQFIADGTSTFWIQVGSAL